MASSAEHLLASLKGVPGVHHVAVFSRTGSLLSASLPPGLHGDTVAAMGALVFGAAEALATELRTSVGSATVGMGDGFLLLLSAGDRGVALVKTNELPDAALVSQLQSVLAQ